MDREGGAGRGRWWAPRLAITAYCYCMCPRPNYRRRFGGTVLLRSANAGEGAAARLVLAGAASSAG